MNSSSIIKWSLFRKLSVLAIVVSILLPEWRASAQGPQSFTVGFKARLLYQPDYTNGDPGKNMGSVKGQVRFTPEARTAEIILADGRHFPVESFTFTHLENGRDGYIWNEFSMYLAYTTQGQLAHAANNSFWRARSTKAAATRVLDRYLAARAAWGTGAEITMSDRMEGGGCIMFYCDKARRIFRTSGSESSYFGSKDPEGYIWIAIKLDRDVRALQ